VRNVRRSAKVATILVCALAAALLATAVGWLSLGSDPEVPVGLVATRFIPAGTPGERILEEGSVGPTSAWPQETRLYKSVNPQPYSLVIDLEYLRGRVAVADLLAGEVLERTDFR
jgi:hypothetical protein